MLRMRLAAIALVALGACHAFNPPSILPSLGLRGSRISGTRRPGIEGVSMRTKITTGEVHNEKGAYVGGYWVPYDECEEAFNIKDGSNNKVDSSVPCPRSRTRHTAAKEDGTYDVIVIGSGAIGSSIARELAKTTASVLVLEAADDVTQGATKGNSGIVHAGFDDKPGSTRAKLCWKGNQMFPQLDEELHFGYQLTGSLVVAKGSKDEEHLQELMERGHKNGVKNLRIVGKEELRKMEPNLHPDATAALFSPDAGTLTPYEYTVALAENAADNGVEFRIRREVESITKEDGMFVVSADYWEPPTYKVPADPKDPGNYYGGEHEGGPYEKYPEVQVQKQVVTVPQMKKGGSGSKAAEDGQTQAKETYKAKYVVNAAGGFSDEISKMIGDDSFKVKPRLGEYILLKKSEGNRCNHILFPCPGPLGKGILVQKTLWGNLILGPTARDVHEWKSELEDPDSKEEILGKILKACRGLVPEFDTDASFHSFAGARSKTDYGDWIIGPSKVDPNFIQAAGIDSPGIAASPAIAKEIVASLKTAGLDLTPDSDFNPKRAPIIFPKNGENDLVFTPDEKPAVNAKGVPPEQNVVCKCEKVTEAEIVAAMQRSLPVDSTQGMRKRTRAGMGGCQAKPWNYGCECRVAQIIARESGDQEVTAQVGRRPWKATSLFERRWITDDDKKELKDVSGAEKETVH
mmetsp:Transcript_55661/g.136368  ORF Transcript_55661/g.136368 Transcript_55661/m.136368 type:complete len:689 (+) Transcript_55661:69-2135(+)